MQTKLFDYHLPERLIAQTPLQERDASRLLIADPATDHIQDSFFANLPSILHQEFCQNGKRPLIVVNRSRVFPARVRIKRTSGGRGEVFILEQNDTGSAVSCLIRPQKKLRVGEILFADQSSEHNPVPLFQIEKLDPPRVIPINSKLSAIMNQHGEMPLPPYIQRDPLRVGKEYSDLDKQRYQTLYAQEEGSVAAATAGLHFTKKIMDECSAFQCEFAEVILHVGLGTFQPVQADTLAEHQMHHENYLIPMETAQKIADWTAKDWPILFVGTTSLRTVESFVRHAFAKHAIPICQLRNYVHEESQHNAILFRKTFENMANIWFSTNLFLHPDNLEHSKTPTLGDAILTNFHQPQSTLTMLVASILSYPFWKKLYAHAVQQEYRFLSYGDSSLLFFAQRTHL